MRCLANCKPHKASLPRVSKGVRTAQVGGNGGTDFSATTTNPISEAEGSFDTVTTTGETNVPATGSNTSESYELQLNIAPISPPSLSNSPCNGSPGTGITTIARCQEWEQFIYTTDGSGEIYTQYWLLQWGKVGDTCQTPISASCDGANVYTDGWCPFTLQDTAGDKFTDCAIGGVTTPSVGTVSVSSLKETTLNAFPADAANTVDNVTFAISGSPPSSAPGANKFPESR